VKAIETVRIAAQTSKTPLSRVSTDMGHARSYVARIATRGSTPRADTLAAMLAPCGYALAAVPVDDLPPSALVVDAAPRG